VQPELAPMAAMKPARRDEAILPELLARMRLQSKVWQAL
jgi:hypothetical protein